MLTKLNFIGIFALILYPILIVALVVNYVIDYQFGWFEVALILLGYYIANISVGVGLHRLWSHDAYKTNKYVEFVLAILTAGTLQGPVLSWASNHYKHHTFTDTENDPHTPLKYKSRIMGFFWSHIGWMLVGEGSYKSIDKLTMVKLGRNKVLRWQLQYYWQIAIAMNTVVPALVGYLLGDGTLLAAYAGFLFIGLARAVQQQVTFFVNSLCHFVGTQKYIDGTSRDIWWLAILLLGENWHNFHHAFPSDYRNGARWYQFDVHKWIIYAMSKLGLAWDLKRTAPVRVEAKMAQTIELFSKLKQEQLQLLQEKIAELTLVCQQKFKELEHHSAKAKKKFLTTLTKTQESLNNIKQQLQNQLKSLDNPPEKLLDNCGKQLKKIEHSLQHVFLEIEKGT